MSLDCYPFGQEQTIGLAEQPMAIDVAYNDDLLVTVVENCRSISIYDLSNIGSNGDQISEPVQTFRIGHNVVIDTVVYCRRGDYLACVGHNNGLLSIYTIFDWRLEDEHEEQSSSSRPNISELSTNVDPKDSDLRDKLNGIDCCQRTGGDSELLTHQQDEQASNEDESQLDLLGVGNGKRASTTKESHLNGGPNDTTLDESSWVKVPFPPNGCPKQHFQHIITLKLSMWASKISLAENYLSIMAVDHVQVLKLELLTLQIQSDGQDGTELLANGNLNNLENGLNNGMGAPGETASVSANTLGTTTCSTFSDTNSTTTNFSSFTNTGQTSSRGHQNQLNNSELSIITLNNQPDKLLGKTEMSNQADDCITWNLDTKKLVKLPTLMHNTSTNLSDYHICHPLELLGPASESIACRVRASIYSPDYSQNQLEAVVMLCKQFDFDRDPVKKTHLQAIYLPNYDHRSRLSRSAQPDAIGSDQNDQDQNDPGKEASLLKSNEHDLLASVTCFVSTLTNCFVYSLHGKKAIRTQVITNPDLCLDLRPDLLNVYLLTPPGLQICSTGACDSTFRYEWSSAADLNLSFTAIDCKRVLTTANYIILVGCFVDENDYLVKFMEKPDLLALYSRIVHTVNHCNSISIRSNLLTYLHATSQLTFLNQRRRSLNQQAVSDTSAKSFNANQPRDQLVLLKQVTIMLCKQLLQKKETNVITNRRIDKTVKHLLDISMCDVRELTSGQLDGGADQSAGGGASTSEASVSPAGSNHVLAAATGEVEADAGEVDVGAGESSRINGLGELNGTLASASDISTWEVPTADWRWPLAGWAAPDPQPATSPSAGLDRVATFTLRDDEDEVVAEEQARGSLIGADENARDGLPGSTGCCHELRSNKSADEEEIDEDEAYEARLQLIAELPLPDLIDLLAVKGSGGGGENCCVENDGQVSDEHVAIATAADSDPEADKAARACIEASIKLLESRFILSRLRERFAAS